MKKPLALVFIIVALAIIAGAVLSWRARTSSQVLIQKDEAEINGLALEKKSSEDQVPGKNNPSAQQTTALKTTKLEDCLPGLKEDSFSVNSEKLHALASGEVLEITEYHLVGSSGEKIIVQQNRNEELKNQVRVFQIAPDGFPDRIKEFPQSSGTMQDRLNGALTLGLIKKTVDKFRGTGLKEGELTFEKESGKISSIAFANGKKQLQCEANGCSCSIFN